MFPLIGADDHHHQNPICDVMKCAETVWRNSPPNAVDSVSKPIQTTKTRGESATTGHRKISINENQSSSSLPKRIRLINSDSVNNFVTTPRGLSSVQLQAGQPGNYSVLPSQPSSASHTLKFSRFSTDNSTLPTPPITPIDVTPKISYVTPRPQSGQSFVAVSAPSTATPTAKRVSGDEAFFRAIHSVWKEIDAKVPSIPKSLNLAMLRSKLKLKMYANPWQFIDDVFAIIDNVKIHFNKNTKSYNYCVEVAGIFQSKINQVMRDLGYCCALPHKFGPKALECRGNVPCYVKVGESYYCYDEMCSSVYCIECFEKLPEVVQVTQKQDDHDPLKDSVPISRFTLRKNNMPQPELLVKCVKCDRSHHQICVNYLPKFSSKFTCGSCSQKNVKSWLRAKDLPTTKLSCWIEQRLDNYLVQNIPEITIKVRVVAAAKKNFHVKPEMAQFPDMPACLPHTAKSIYAFIDKGDYDLCFFGIYVQEYGEDAGPNTGRVYISYIDSVNYFQPKENRSAVYKEIVLGYLDHVRKLGYSFVHIWVCPATRKTSDYLFHAHPPEQKFPTVARLQDWYQSLSKKGEEYGVMMKMKSLIKHLQEENITSASQVPYFDGDFWPGLAEKVIRTAREETNKRKEKLAVVSRKMKPELTPSGEHVWNKLRKDLEKNIDVFYVARLNSQNNLVPDPDCLIQCKLLENRLDFVDHCHRKHYEFSTLRRAKYSTIAIISEIFHQLKVFCNHCQEQIPTRYERFNFNQCFRCNSEDQNPLKENEEATVADSVEKAFDEHITPINYMEDKKAAYLVALVHAYRCNEENCEEFGCSTIRRHHSHKMKGCLKTWNCSMCFKFNRLIGWHSEECGERGRCPVRGCDTLRAQYKANGGFN